MHHAPDAVAYQRAHNRETGRFGRLLNGMRDIAQPVARPGLLYSCRKRRLAGGKQCFRLDVDSAYRESERCVCDEPVQGCADINRDDLARVEHSPPRNPVNDHRARRGADRRGITAVAFEGRLGALRADELFSEGVQLTGRDTGRDRTANERQRTSDELTGPCHLLDLLSGFSDDHAAESPSSPSTRSISANTSSTLGAASIPTRIPLLL